jgi:predicted dehydrogenase
MPFDVIAYGVGVIGTGRLSDFVIERLTVRPDFQLAGLIDDESSWQTVLDNPQIPIVYFAAPPSAQLVEAAIRQHKAVVLSTFDTLASGDLVRPARMAQDQGTIAVVDAARRFDRDFVAACESVQAGFLGQPTRFRLAIHEQSLPGESFSRGILREFGIHWFDQLLALTASEPATVRLTSFASHESADGLLAIIDFADGATAVIELQMGSLLSLRTGWLVEGTAGAYRAGRRYTQTSDGEIVDEPVTLPDLSVDPFFDHLSAMMRGEAAPLAYLPNLAHAARVMRLIELLEESPSPSLR